MNTWGLNFKAWKSSGRNFGTPDFAFTPIIATLIYFLQKVGNNALKELSNTADIQWLMYWNMRHTEDKLQSDIRRVVIKRIVREMTRDALMNCSAIFNPIYL